MKGAALANSVFRGSGISLLVLSLPDLIDPFFYDIAGQLGMGYGEVFGTLTETSRPTSHNAFRVASEKVGAMLGMAPAAGSQGGTPPSKPGRWTSSNRERLAARRRSGWPSTGARSGPKVVSSLCGRRDSNPHGPEAEGF